MGGTGEGGERSPLLGGPPLKGRGVACAAVLAMEGLEKAAFFGIAANLAFYLTSSALGWGGSQAACACLLFLGASYLLSPVGGWLADVYLGRYGAVAISFSLYLLAASLLPVTAWPDGRLSVCGHPPAGTTLNCSWHRGGTCRGTQYCAPTIYAGLLVMALGASSVRANLTPFGADQVRRSPASFSFFPWEITPHTHPPPWICGSPFCRAEVGRVSREVAPPEDHLQSLRDPWEVLAGGRREGRWEVRGGMGRGGGGAGGMG